MLNVSNKTQHSRAAAENTTSDWETEQRIDAGQILVMGQWPPESAAFTCESEISPAGAPLLPKWVWKVMQRMLVGAAMRH